MKRILEVCCYSVESALKAESFGAHRIELCDNFSEGGTTPSFASISYALEHLEIPINVMIRPRGGDFLYSDVDYEIIKTEVAQVKKMGVNGVVLGFLRSNGEIDLRRTKEIVDLAGNLETTFHRAFDMCKNPKEALEQLIEIGVTRILTSGARKNVASGQTLLAELVAQAKGRIVVMPGCGLSPDNIKALINKTDATEYHTASKAFEPSLMAHFNPHISMGGVSNVDEYKTISVDESKIKAMLAILDAHP